jgi:TolB-like protein/DNA-binding SARP family transcriptional activator
MDAASSPKFRLCVLGRFELNGPKRAIDLPSKKLAGLLAYLACTSPAPQHREKLATLLWGSHFEAQAKQNFRQALFRLRRMLGQDVLLSNGEELSLARGSIDCDATKFEALIRQGTREAFVAAIDLYKGRLLGDVTLTEEAWIDWLDGERQRLEGLALDAMVRLGDMELEAGSPDRALGAAARAIAINNLREDAHRLEIRALAAAGRRADALKQYRGFVELLKRELNVEPDDTTKHLIHELRGMASSEVLFTKGSGDSGSLQSRATISLLRGGDRFAGPAVAKSEDRVPATPTVDAATRPAPVAALSLPDKPSIAVLPFDNLSGDPEQGYFADGMVEEIITALSRIHWLFVIARNSSFTYKGRTVDIKQVGRELGVLYVLEGSVRKAGNRIRITAQLLDAANGAHLWADRFDATLEDIFDLQDKVASSVAGVIEPTLQAAEHRRSIRRPTDDLTAYDLFLQARVALYSASREGAIRALELAEQALERDPNYGSALAVAARCHSNFYGSGWTNDLEATRKEGIKAARRALRVAGDDPFILSNAAYALAHFGEDIAKAIALVDHSLQLNPSFARGWYLSGWLRLWAGQYDLAIEHFERSNRLDPRQSRDSTHFSVGVGHFLARRIEKAAEMLGLSLQENSEWPPTLRFMASCLAHMGRLKEAQEIVKRLREITHVVIPTAEHWRIREDREYYLDGLRLAAGVAPEEPAGH